MRKTVQFLCVAAAGVLCVAHAADAPEKNFDLTITHGALPAAQRMIKVEKGDTLRVHITSDAPGELHLHGYRLATKLIPGQPAEFAFKTHATGRFPFEWHGAEKPAGTGAHHGPPLATLEVRPK
jgi:FtsP/CotA-like multicopper oxidase with cupredoxin domain